ncbi:MAG: sulfatase-like hydrolase/transferase [Thiolinea sp.]
MRISRWSPLTLILAVLVFIGVFHNLKLWQALAGRLDVWSLHGAGYMLTLFMVMLVILFLLSVVGQGRLLKPWLILLCLLSAVLSYFTTRLGVAFDPEMLRNVLDNLHEHNQQEAVDLLSAALFKHVFWLGVLPAVLIAWIPLKPRPWYQTSLLHGLAAALLVAVAAGLFMANFKYATYFFRENRDLRIYITPQFAVLSAWQLYDRLSRKADAPFHAYAGHYRAGTPLRRRKTVGIMVLGETARADHFALNGYERPTNPQLTGHNDLVSFRQVWSCGTSTAYSVPCMFSFLGQDEYSPEKARRQSNSLDVLADAGVGVYWIENNSGCKGVCDRLTEGHYHSILKPEDNFDAQLLTELDQLLPTLSHDSLIVLHSMGSHGPAYHQRYPQQQAAFKPYCASSAPQDCSPDDIINAYDNTIHYTDQVLAQIIQRLEAQPDMNTFMLYASDHGESLGENGVYLHGLPYLLAPDAQKHVPVLWASPAYQDQHQFDLPDWLQRDWHCHMTGCFRIPCWEHSGVMSPAYRQDLDYCNWRIAEMQTVLLQ